MRKDEEFCKQAFDTFLKSICRGDDIVWSCGDEPPDYYLELSGTRFAVEVTSILEKAKLGGGEIDHINIDMSIKKFVDDIKKEAIAEGFLSGAYRLQYKPLRDFGRQKQVISTRIKGYLKRTQNVSSAPVEDIVGKGHLGWYIQKVHSQRSYLARATSDAKWKCEAVDELCNLLNKTLETKTKKLGAISLPKILLIYDRFAWINASEWEQYLPRLSALDNFHTIFLVSGKSSNSILYSVQSSFQTGVRQPSSETPLTPGSPTNS